MAAAVEGLEEEVLEEAVFEVVPVSVQVVPVSEEAVFVQAVPVFDQAVILDLMDELEQVVQVVAHIADHIFIRGIIIIIIVRIDIGMEDGTVQDGGVIITGHGTQAQLLVVQQEYLFACY